MKILILVLVNILVCTLGLNLLNNARAQPQPNNNVFTIRLATDIEMFDWNMANFSINSIVLKNIMEGLFETDLNFKLQPRLAESYTISDDGKNYKIKIKKNIKWSDGIELTSQHFFDSWQRLLGPLSTSQYAEFLFDIEGAENYRKGVLKDFAKVGIKVIDRYTLDLRLKKRCPYFLDLLSMWVTFPIRNDLIQKYQNQWTDIDKIVVLGPYKPLQYEKNKLIRLIRNENYFDKAAKISELRILIINDDSSAMKLFKTGNLDHFAPSSFLEASQYAQSPEFHSYLAPRTSYLFFNTTQYPLNLAKVRQAIALAIDKTKISEVLHQKTPAAHSFAFPKILPEGSQSGLMFNREQAIKLLASTGVDPKKFSIEIDFVAVADDQTALIATFLKDQLKKNLNLTLNIKLLDFEEFRQLASLRNGGIFYFNWGADYIDPHTFLSVFLSYSSNNRFRWKNSQFDELVEKAGEMKPGNARNLLYTKALEILQKEEAVVVPIFYNQENYLLKTRVQNFAPNPLGDIFLRSVYFK